MSPGRLLCALLVLSACRRDDPAPAATPAAAAPVSPAAALDGGPARPPAIAALTWYRAALDLGAAGEAIFFLALPAAGATDRPVIASGPERVEGELARDGDAVRIEFPLFYTRLVLRPAAAGGFTGAFESSSPSWGKASLPLVATPVAAPSITAMATASDGAPLDLGAPRTIWRFSQGDYAGKLVIEQRAPGEFTTSFLLDNANRAYLDGNGRGDQLIVSGFDAVSPYRVELVFDAARRTLSGTWLSGQNLGWQESIRGTRTEVDFELPAKVAAEAPDQELELPQLAGLEGKPVLVELSGSWCSTCKHATPVLLDLWQQHHASGLEIVTLLYEFHDDAAAGKKAVELYTRAHAIPWRVVAVPGAPEDFADLVPPGLVDLEVGGFPLALFLRRDRTLAGLHAGFPAEVAGPAHAEAIATYRRLAGEIMATAR